VGFIQSVKWAFSKAASLPGLAWLGRSNNNNVVFFARGLVYCIVMDFEGFNTVKAGIALAAFGTIGKLKSLFGPRRPLAEAF